MGKAAFEDSLGDEVEPRPFATGNKPSRKDIGGATQSLLKSMVETHPVFTQKAAGHLNLDLEGHAPLRSKSK